jgi:drug/metabolite transporter (DMT)-like permease
MTSMTETPSFTRLESRFRDWALLLFCNLIWASQFAMVRLVQKEMGFIFAMFFPMALATLILLPFVLRQRRAMSAGVRAPVSAVDLGHFALLGVLGQVVAQLGVTWGAQWSTASTAALLFLGLPIVTTVMAFFLLGERMTPIRLAALVLALLGVLASSGIDISDLRFADSKSLWGNLLIFAGVAGSAFYNVYSKRMMHRYSPLDVLFYSYIAVLIVMLPVTLALEPSGVVNLLHYSFTVWVGILMLALFQYALSMVIFLRVLNRVDATQAAVMNYLIPFFGVVIGWALLGERMTSFMMVGGLLGLGSTLLATVFDKPQAQTSVIKK